VKLTAEVRGKQTRVRARQESESRTFQRNRGVYGPKKDQTGWRIRNNDELQVVYRKPNTVTTVKYED
jgi:hypothetical protein